MSWGFPVIFIFSGFTDEVVQFVNQFVEACMGFITFIGGETGQLVKWAE